MFVGISKILIKIKSLEEFELLQSGIGAYGCIEFILLKTRLFAFPRYINELPSYR